VLSKHASFPKVSMIDPTAACPLFDTANDFAKGGPSWHTVKIGHTFVCVA
jgi:hypothetical protein